MGALPTGTTARLLPTDGATALRALPETPEPPARLHAVPDLPSSRKMPRSAGETAPSAATRYARLSDVWAMSSSAEVAYADLNHMLLLTKERGEEIPCLGPGGQAWTSDDYDDQQVAADRCLDCPAMLLCRAYAEAAGEKAGTWGGETRDPARKPPLDTRRAQADRARRKQKKARSGGGIVPDYFHTFEWKLEAEAPGKPKTIGYPTMTKTNTPAKVQIDADGNLVGGHFCKCDCGEVITTKASYRPGHDARHAGIVARAIADDPKQTKALLSTLPSAALQAKATRAAEKLAAKMVVAK